MSASLPSLGYGLGLRSEYYHQILEQSPAVLRGAFGLWTPVRVSGPGAPVPA